MRRFPVYRALLAVAALAALTGTALADFSPVGSLLFRDTFNYGTEWTYDVNYGIDSPSRVSGPLARQVSYDQVSSIGVTDIDGPNQKFDMSDGWVGATTARIGLTKDFNGALAQGGMTVCVKVLPWAGYAGIGAGHSGSAYTDVGDLFGEWLNVPGFYFNAFAAGSGLNASAFASDGSAQWFSKIDLGPGYGNFVDLAMVFTDVDNNPFNGSGTITANLYVDGTWLASATGPDFAHNYLSFQTNTTMMSSYKDLRVYGNASAVPEPGTLALLGVAIGAAVVWFRRRR